MTALLNRRSLLAALPAVVATPALSGEILPPLGSDPMVGLCGLYIEVFKRQEVASGLEGEGNFDGPVTSDLEVKRGRLFEAIKETPITTAAGLAAFCRFVHVDNYIGDETVSFPDMHRWQWEKISEWAEARAPIG